MLSTFSPFVPPGCAPCPLSVQVRDGGGSASFKLRYSFQGFQMVQLKEKITVIFFQKKTEKRKLYFKWKDAKKQGRRRNGAVYIPLIFCRPGTYLCLSFIGFCSWNADFLTIGLPFSFFLIQLLINGSGGVEKAGKTALSKRWPVAANSGGTERFADTQGTKCEPSASGARVVQKED